MQTLISQQNTTFFLDGEQLPTEVDYLWLITSGVVKTFTQGQNGTSITLGFWGNKDVVGNSLSKVDPYIMRCLSDVKAIAIPRIQWGSLSREMIYCQQQTQQLIYIVRNTKVSQRLWLLLTWLASKFGRIVSYGKLIDFKLTHQELANALGTTRITVTKILNQFEQDGLIMRPKTRCIILKK
ncbi:Crp/Fnr family transcriptional regulator [Waterburya agarophytonicola K14]|uniref:Crp/Fnr family transcriptional regulator n=1 Tax=Waterburya agarophytonicola KI4 TaxID=2874699 RepID=A0A964FER8_9CYAN|nr:Crp/Fnr family transcriptional regulator [Waterburya agarophytonicola]MCC0176202.1 Crp/Fnr family transcriptional regulator [Waterburya agarophytonicola KI4]